MNKILIVEDESVVALDIASALRKEGYEVVDIVEDSNAAFDAIEKKHPDLIVMDIHIDGTIDGIDTSRRIKATYDIPLIFLTAYNDKKTIDRAVQTVPKGYLIKPFKRQELYAAVALALNASSYSEKIISVSDGCLYYPERSRLEHSGKDFALTKKEKQLLELLLIHRDNVVPFECIEYELWPEKEVSATTRRTLIYRLREKVGNDVIQTIKDIGCILES
jgi:DNA-binding response OmpR family regulator